MAIQTACPKCRHAVKVKDELAGRKVKCPKCAAPIAIPHPAPRLDEIEEEIDDVPEKDEKPRKNKKGRKKKAGNMGLIIGLSVGGGVLLIVLVITLILVFNRGSAGPANPGGAGPGGPNWQRSGGPVSQEQELRLTRVKAFATAIQRFAQPKNRAPKNVGEIGSELAEISASNKLDLLDCVNAVKSGQITVIWECVPEKIIEGAGNVIIAYETQPDSSGVRAVAKGDATVMLMNEAVFSAAPKASRTK